MAGSSQVSGSNVAPGTVMFTGMWLNPGQDAKTIWFVKKGNEEAGVFSVMFGSSHLDQDIPMNDWIKNAGGYQSWVQQDNHRWGASVGFHHSNSTDERLRSHWMVSHGGGFWRNGPEKTEIMVMTSLQSDGMPRVVLPGDEAPVPSLTCFARQLNISLTEADIKIFMEWFHPTKPLAYVALRRDSSVQYVSVDKNDEGAVGNSNGIWSYFTRPAGEYLLVWFHYTAKRKFDGSPAAEATVLKKLYAYPTEAGCGKTSVWRAVGTLGRKEDGSFDYSDFVEKSSAEMKHWHIVARILWQTSS